MVQRKQKDAVGQSADKPSRGNLSDIAFTGIRDMILNGDLAPDQRVLEVDCAQRLGISRTPVREAIARLASEGLIRRAENGPPLVSRISVDQIVDILRVRRLLEVETVRRACDADGREELLRIRQTLSGFLETGESSAEDHKRLDEHLHATLATMARSEVLRDMVANLRLRTRMFDKAVLPDRFIPGAQEHIAIIDAVLSGNADTAEAAMRAHLDNAAQRIIDHLKVMV